MTIRGLIKMLLDTCCEMNGPSLDDRVCYAQPDDFWSVADCEVTGVSVKYLKGNRTVAVIEPRADDSANGGMDRKEV